MSEYIVSARKYRPVTFDSVVGQRALTTTLKNAIATGKLAHAYLFCGPRGVGKTTSARIFAKTINCLNPNERGEACGECESCRAFDEGRSFNISELDAASNNSVDDIRDLIDQVQIAPQIGKYKVFIIDEVHMLSQAAFNAFLKTLEEPPAHAIFILATTEKHKILPTILSRCQTYDFNRMEVTDIVEHLKGVATKEGYTYEESALNVIARKADGGMRDALSIFDQVASYTNGNITYQKVIDDLNVLDYEYYFRATDLALTANVPALMLLLDEVIAKGFAPNLFVSGLASHFRDLLVSRDAQTTTLLEVESSIRQRYAEQAQRCKPQMLYSALRLCNDCDQHYNASSNKRLLVELTLIEVAQLCDEDAPGSGRRPTKKHILRPIFAHIVALNKTATSDATPARGEAAGHPIVQTPAKPVITVSTSVNPPTTQSAVRRQGISRISLRDTRSNLVGDANNTSTQAVQTSPDNDSRVKNHQPLDLQQLQLCWLKYANQLSKQQAPLRGRMTGMTPIIEEPDTAVISVENEDVAHFMGAAKPNIESYLRKALLNDSFKLEIRVEASPTNERRYVSKREIFEDLKQKNPAFLSLVKSLALELD